jgi:thiamine-monophosphate kinase
LETVPIAPAAHDLAARNSITRRGGAKTPLDHALGDGEDFELILAVPAAEADRMLKEQPLGVPLTCIGEFIAEPGLWQLLPGGERQKLEPRGGEHQME